MKRFFFLLAFCLPSYLSAADYQRPEVDVPTQWKHGSSNARSSLPDEWWMQFQVPTLNELVARALSANLDISSAQARVETARALLGMKRADWFPQLAFNGNVGATRLSQSSFGANLPPQFGDVSSLLERDQYRASLDVSYEIDLWGRIRRSVESAEAKARASDETVAAYRLIVAAEVCRSYILLCSLDWQTQILQDTVKVREEALQLQKSKLAGGLGNEMELNHARTEAELAKADLAALKGQRHKTENALAVLCGTPSSRFAVAAQSKFPELPSVPAGLPSELLAARPDLRAAEAQMQSAHAEIGAARAAFFPTFKLTGSAGLESIEASSIADWENRTYSIGPSFSIPLFQGGRLKSQLKAARAAKEEAIAMYKQSILTAVREVEDALVDLNSLHTQSQAIQQAQQAADETARLTRVRQSKGLASYFEVVEAERTALGTMLRKAQLQGQLGVSTVLLFQALGGGWKY
jgi:outer membrane protein, multidrug efflux system